MTGAKPTASCSRRWEVSAARDGRIVGKDLDSLGRHLAGCAVCRKEQKQLSELAESLRSLPSLPDDVLAARRLRQRLLADTDRWLTGATPPPRSRVLGASAALLSGAALVALGYFWLIKPAQPARTALPLPSAGAPLASAVRVDVVAAPATLWRKHQRGDELLIELDSGQISAKIGARRPGQRVRIQLPDGLIEDLGTVLSVDVHDEHTTQVRVQEGRVILRLNGLEPIELGAGEGWSRPPAQATSAAAPLPAPAPTNARASRTAPSLGVAAAARPPAPAASATPAGASSAAVADDGAAARLAREEDEAYLHIVALARAHQTPEARAAAKEYLLRFPNGFRREEVLGVATH